MRLDEFAIFMNKKMYLDEWPDVPFYTWEFSILKADLDVPILDELFFLICPIFMPTNKKYAKKITSAVGIRCFNFYQRSCIR